MRIKIFEFNRYRETPEQFEVGVREFVKDSPIVTEMKLWENLSNSDIVIQLTLGEESIASQDFILWHGLDLETAEGQANTTLEAVSHAGKKAKHLSIISLSKSNRSVMAMIIQGEGSPHGIETAEQVVEEAPTESHTSVNEGTDARAKRGGKHRDRKTTP